MKFNQLVGKSVSFYGVDNNAFCIGIQNKDVSFRFAFEAVEDEDDGYRSMMEEIVEVPIKGYNFFRDSIAQVEVVVDEYLEGYKLVDLSTGHVWLEFGTDRTDDSYPFFVFRYQPMHAG